MTEIWKDIKDYEGTYQVSNKGRVKSLSRHISRGNHTMLLREKILRAGINPSGYCDVVLSLNKKGKTKTVHRLVLSAFVSNPKNKRTVNHINGIKTDNRLENLEWATYSENTQHALKIGTMNNNVLNKPVLMLSLDNLFIKKFESIIYASKETKIDNGNISSCCKGRLLTAGGYKWEYYKKEETLCQD